VWIAFSIFCCLLFYAGKSNGPEPPFSLCLAQASLLYGAQPMLNLAALGVVVQMWFWLRIISFDAQKALEGLRKRTIAFVVAPYVIFIVFIIAAVADGTRHPEKVSRQRSFLYCSIDSHIDVISSFVSVFFGFVTLGFEAWTAFLLSREWSSTITDLKLPHTKLAFNVRLIKRLVIFSVFAIIVYGSAILQINHAALIYAFAFLAALMPLAVFLIFGTQWSILRVWCFWRPRKPRSESDVVEDEKLKFQIVNKTRPVAESRAEGGGKEVDVDWMNGWEKRKWALGL